MARPRKHDGSLFRKEGSKFWWMDYRDRAGKRQRESTNTDDWEEAQKRLRARLQSRDNNTLPLLRKGEQFTFAQWSMYFLETFAKPPMRARKTHLSYTRAANHLNAEFGEVLLVDLTADAIETHLRRRLEQRVQISTSGGKVAKGLVKPSTVHQEFRVLRRMLNVAVRKKLLVANPCSGVEFPVRVTGLFRPHYMTWSERRRSKGVAPDYLRNVIRIITETGLRVYKELAPMKKEDVDLANAIVWIPDSKTPSGVAEVPLTEMAAEAFKQQISVSGTVAVPVSKLGQSVWLSSRLQEGVGD
jgi:integrase